jgi:hypothetical protein
MEVFRMQTMVSETDDDGPDESDRARRRSAVVLPAGVLKGDGTHER